MMVIEDNEEHVVVDEEGNEIYRSEDFDDAVQYAIGLCTE
jgi:hypothetical protein